MVACGPLWSFAGGEKKGGGEKEGGLTEGGLILIFFRDFFLLLAEVGRMGGKRGKGIIMTFHM